MNTASANLSPQEGARRILVVRTDRLGDVVLSTPVFSALRRRFPLGCLAVLLRPYTVELVEGHPDVDLILSDDRDGKHRSLKGLIRLIREIRRHGFDIAILLHPTFRLALACRLARIPVRIGTGYRGYSLLFNRRIYQHRKSSGRHELDLNFDLLQPLGISQEMISFSLSVPASAMEKTRSMLAEMGLSASDPFVVLHPGSGGSASDWPVHGFAALADMIQEKSGCAVVVTGNKREMQLVDIMAAMVKNPIIRLDGRLQIKELLALLKQARLLVANSTGPLHMAVAMGTAVVGLYCPLPACSPRRWGPYHQPDAVILPPSPCNTTCDSRKNHNSPCMEAIRVEDVYHKVKETLSGT